MCNSVPSEVVVVVADWRLGEVEWAVASMPWWLVEVGARWLGGEGGDCQTVAFVREQGGAARSWRGRGRLRGCCSGLLG